MKKILHIASFKGNIGDYLNHKGLYKVMSENLNFEYEIVQEEIRDYYFSIANKRFDNNFVELCNKFDYVIFGGGNFFEVKWDNSATGTTFDMTEDTINKITAKMLFFGLGFDLFKGYSEKSLSDFQQFIENLNKKLAVITVRNDGSFENLNKVYTQDFIKNANILKVLDGAFLNDIRINESNNYIAINIAQDMPEFRFDKVTQVSFEKQISEFCNLKIKEGKRIKFVPHIKSDVEIMENVVREIKDNDKVEIIELVESPEEFLQIVNSIYAKSDFNICVRFHANIISLLNSKKTIAINTYDKIHDLYTDIELVDNLVEADEKLLNSLIERSDIIKEDKMDLTNRIMNTQEVLINFFKE